MGSYRGNMELVHCYFRCTFNIRVESVREGGKVKQKTLKYFGTTPALPLKDGEGKLVTVWFTNDQYDSIGFNTTRRGDSVADYLKYLATRPHKKKATAS